MPEKSVVKSLVNTKNALKVAGTASVLFLGGGVLAWKLGAFSPKDPEEQHSPDSANRSQGPSPPLESPIQVPIPNPSIREPFSVSTSNTEDFDEPPKPITKPKQTSPPVLNNHSENEDVGDNEEEGVIQGTTTHEPGIQTTTTASVQEDDNENSEDDESISDDQPIITGTTAEELFQTFIKLYKKPRSVQLSSEVIPSEFFSAIKKSSLKNDALRGGACFCDFFARSKSPMYRDQEIWVRFWRHLRQVFQLFLSRNALKIDLDLDLSWTKVTDYAFVVKVDAGPLEKLPHDSNLLSLFRALVVYNNSIISLKNLLNSEYSEYMINSKAILKVTSEYFLQANKQEESFLGNYVHAIWQLEKNLGSQLSPECFVKPGFGYYFRDVSIKHLTESLALYLTDEEKDSICDVILYSKLKDKVLSDIYTPRKVNEKEMEVLEEYKKLLVQTSSMNRMLAYIVAQSGGAAPRCTEDGKWKQILGYEGNFPISQQIIDFANQSMDEYCEKNPNQLASSHFEELKHAYNEKIKEMESMEETAINCYALKQ